MPQCADATVAPAAASTSEEASMGGFARAASEAAPTEWWAPKLSTHSSGPAPERQSSRQSPQVSWSPHTTPTSPMNRSREMSQLSMFRMNSETDMDQASSCGGDLGPCTSDGMPTSAPSSAFNLGPIAQPKIQPGAGAQAHHRALSMQHRPTPAEGQGSSQEGAQGAPLFLPLPQPQQAPVPLGETLVGLSTVVLDGESGVHQKASLDSSASVWSPLLTTGVAALQTTGGASSGRGEAAAPTPRLPAAPSLQSWAGSVEGPAALAGLTSTYSSPVAAGREAEITPRSPAVQVGEIMAAGRDSDAMVQGGSVSLSMLAQGPSMQSSPQLPVSSREGTPTGASPGKSWGGPDAARFTLWEPQSLEGRPGSLPVADPPSASGVCANAAVDAMPGEGRRQAKSLDHGQYLHERDSWAASYNGPGTRSPPGAVSGPSEPLQDTSAGASICARLREGQRREAERHSSEPTGTASRLSRPALRERTDSAVYHRADHEGAPVESTSRQEARALPQPSSLQGPARERSGELVKEHSGAAGLGGIQEEPAQRGRPREGELDAAAHVLRANLSSTEVQLSRRARDMLESGPAPGPLLTQAGIGGYKTAAPAGGSAPASGDLRKSSLWDDSARTSCGHTDADGADKPWPGLGMSSAPNSGNVLRSFASAHDGSRLDRELSSPYTSSAFPQGEGVPGAVLTGQQSTEPVHAQHDSHEHLEHQRSSTERQRGATTAAESRARTAGRSEAQQPALGTAAVRETAARERAEDSGGRARRGAESSALSSGSGGPRLTEALLAELEAHYKLQARKEKLVDVHERTRAWLAAAEVPLETEARARKLAAAKIKSFRSSDSANQRSSSSPVKAANKKAESSKQKKQGALSQWFSCFAGGGVK